MRRTNQNGAAGLCQMAETGEEEVSEMHENWERARRCRGAVEVAGEMYLRPPGSVHELVVHPTGGGGWVGSGFFSISAAQVAEVLKGIPVSAEPDRIYRLLRGQESYLLPFFSRLREESREGLEKAAFWIQPKVRPARAFWQGRTLVVEYSDRLGLVIGSGGSNIRRFQTALARHGLRVVVRLTAEAEAEKSRRDAEVGAAAVRQRAAHEAERPAREAAAAARATDARRQLLLRKELLERKLKEQEGSGREESILELLLKCEEELAALEGR